MFAKRWKSLLGVTAVALGTTAALAPTADAAPTGPAYVYLVAAHSGKCVDVAGVSPANGTPIQQWDCLGINQPNQKFRLVSAAPNSGYYELVAVHSGRCLDVTGASQSDGAPVQQYDCLGAYQYNQQFAFRQFGANLFELVARHSGKCLDVRAVSQADGAALQQWDCLGANQPNQLFAARSDTVLYGSKHTDSGAWHQYTNASLVKEYDVTTNAHTRAYVVATSSSWSDSPFGFKAHTAVSLAPSNVAVPALPGQPTGVSGWSSSYVSWGGPFQTPIPLSTADTTTSITPVSVFS